MARLCRRHGRAAARPRAINARSVGSLARLTPSAGRFRVRRVSRSRRMDEWGSKDPQPPAIAHLMDAGRINARHQGDPNFGESPVGGGAMGVAGSQLLTGGGAAGSMLARQQRRGDELVGGLPPLAQMVRLPTRLTVQHRRSIQGSRRPGRQGCTGRTSRRRGSPGRLCTGTIGHQTQRRPPVRRKCAANAGCRTVGDLPRGVFARPADPMVQALDGAIGRRPIHG